ncbi:hypothetical protein E5288_WYG007861 [Bos mutus]|uniref:Uncharacterized protein n=1 Tax=Bos mutus TaxID=72004 RepID=A0A6B0RGI8_9CETA|nr:hypothetical protein [Bos mutus]
MKCTRICFLAIWWAICSPVHDFAMLCLAPKTYTSTLTIVLYLTASESTLRAQFNILQVRSKSARLPHFAPHQTTYLRVSLNFDTYRRFYGTCGYSIAAQGHTVPLHVEQLYLPLELSEPIWTRHRPTVLSRWTVQPEVGPKKIYLSDDGLAAVRDSTTD